MKDCLKSTLYSIFVLIILFRTSPFAFAENKGEELYRQGKFKEALEAFTQADKDNPKDVRFRYNRGCAAFQNEDLEGSEAAFASVLKRTDDQNMRFRALYNRGAAAFKKGDMGKAVSDFKEALKINPTDQDARYNFELALRMKKEAEEKEKDSEGEKGEGTSEKNGEQNQSEKSDNPEGAKDESPSKGQQEKDQNQGSPDQDGKGEEEEKPQDKSKDLSGDLTGTNNDGNAKKEMLHNAPVSDAQMARNKAEALLENVQDDRSVLLEAMKGQKKEISRSGKRW